MAAKTLEECKTEAREMIDLCIEAKRRVLRSQAYNNSGMSMTYARLEEIDKEQKRWETTLAELNGHTGRIVRQVIPRDN